VRIRERRKAKEVAAGPRSRLSGVRRLQHQRASALCQSGKVESVGGTQAAREAARETARGSPQGETNGSERVNPTGASAEHRTRSVTRALALVATAVSYRVRPAPREACAPDSQELQLRLALSTLETAQPAGRRDYGDFPGSGDFGGSAGVAGSHSFPWRRNCQCPR